MKKTAKPSTKTKLAKTSRASSPKKSPPAKSSAKPGGRPGSKPGVKSAARPNAKTAPLKKAALKKPASLKPQESRGAGKKNKVSAENREAIMAKLIVKALEDLKGKNISTLDVRHLTDVMDIMILVSGTSNRHVKSLADNAMLSLKKVGYRHYGMEGEDAGEWVLVDFGGVVLHVMQPHIREFYDLERLWGTPRAPSE